MIYAECSLFNLDPYLARIGSPALTSNACLPLFATYAVFRLRLEESSAMGSLVLHSRTNVACTNPNPKLSIFPFSKCLIF